VTYENKTINLYAYSLVLFFLEKLYAPFIKVFFISSQEKLLANHVPLICIFFAVEELKEEVLVKD
jgi:hypothetical protein